MGRSDEGLNSDGQNIKGAWSVGRQLIIGDPVGQVSMQAEFEPADWTVQFDLTVPAATQAKLIDAGIGNTIIRAEALITWSVQGNQCTRRVSVGNGVSVSGNGEGVRVVMQDVTFTGSPPGSFISTGFPYDVTATVTRGTRPSVNQPPLLFAHAPPGQDDTAIGVGVAPGPGNLIQIPIPQDAGAISVLVSVGSNGTPMPEQSIQVMQIVGDVTSTFSILALYDPRAFDFCPLVAGATSIAILNNSLTLAVTAQVYFGIDG